VGGVREQQIIPGKSLKSHRFLPKKGGARTRSITNQLQAYITNWSVGPYVDFGNAVDLLFIQKKKKKGKGKEVGGGRKERWDGLSVNVV